MVCGTKYIGLHDELVVVTSKLGKLITLYRLQKLDPFIVQCGKT
jgi:hypothetical protein